MSYPRLLPSSRHQHRAPHPLHWKKMKTKTPPRQRRQLLQGDREWESLLLSALTNAQERNTCFANEDRQVKASLVCAVSGMHLDGSSPAPMSCGSLRFLPLTAGLTAAADISQSGRAQAPQCQAHTTPRCRACSLVAS
jgi:hypothetical protein